ncbi:YgiQ family radical SAM protein [bacterium]|nr:YgiQ family radical SAM protein [bacterium]
MYLPCTKSEMKKLGWERCDIILITGDAYIDSPFIGAALIGRVLFNAGFKVGMIPQPGLNSDADISRLGEPLLFWGVTGGSVDSMVANYTASGKRRKRDDYTPGGVNSKRPDRAVIAYTNLIKRYFKNTKPIVLGGVEASLRCIAHYDAWSRSIRRSILFDAKADYIVYGMGDRSVRELAEDLSHGGNGHSVRGVCYISSEPEEDFIELPDYQTVKQDNHAFIEMFRGFYDNNDPVSGRGLMQKQDTRYLIHNPPAEYLSQKELDDVYNMDFELDVHPVHRKEGEVRALETIRFSITSHRGCYGECNFCSIAVHQGRRVRWRSIDSIVKEAEKFTKHPAFKGIISDVGGPTANMYGFECSVKEKAGPCRDRRCLYPEVCELLVPSHKGQIEILKRISRIPGVRKVFVASGIRHDIILEDQRYGDPYLKEVVFNHTSGQLKIAPEHTEQEVLDVMGKPGTDKLLKFREKFFKYTKAAGKKQFLTYYFIAAHPGSTKKHMENLKSFTDKYLKIVPEQVQIFTPLPLTWSSIMYATGINPFTMQPIFVERDKGKKEIQKSIITGSKKKNSAYRKYPNRRSRR